MATEKTDVVIVGVGAAGAVLAAELAKAGLKVTALERGPRHTTADFAPQDELRFFQRQDLRPDPKRQPVTWRPSPKVRATPLRSLSSATRSAAARCTMGRFPGASTRTISAPARIRSSATGRRRFPPIPRSPTGH